MAILQPNYVPHPHRVSSPVSDVTRDVQHTLQVTLTQSSKDELQSLLMRVTKESGKNELKCNIQKTKILASGPIISWQKEEKKIETVPDFILWLQPQN